MKSCYESQVELKKTGRVIASSKDMKYISGIVRALWEKSIKCTIVHPSKGLNEILIDAKNFKRATEIISKSKWKIELI